MVNGEGSDGAALQTSLQFKRDNNDWHLTRGGFILQNLYYNGVCVVVDMWIIVSKHHHLVSEGWWKLCRMA
jgi:hypothetical protein